MIRLRANLSHVLRGIARRIDALANRLDPIKIDLPVIGPYNNPRAEAARQMAIEIVTRAMAER